MGFLRLILCSNIKAHIYRFLKRSTISFIHRSGALGVSTINRAYSLFYFANLFCSLLFFLATTLWHNMGISLLNKIGEGFIERKSEKEKLHKVAFFL